MAKRRRQTHFRYRGGLNRKGRKRRKPTVQGLYDFLSRMATYFWVKATLTNPWEAYLR